MSARTEGGCPQCALLRSLEEVARRAQVETAEEVERLRIALEREHAWAIDYREQRDALEAKYEEAVSAHWATQTYLDEARAAIARVRALADHFQFAVDNNEITAVWVTDIRNALAGDKS